MYMLALVERAEPGLLGPHERRWHADLARELPNLRAALAWGLAHDVDTTLRIGGALWPYWAWYELGEGRRWLEAALNHPSSKPNLTRARALATDAALAILTADAPRSAASSEAAITLARESAHPVCEAEAHWIRASCHFYAGDLAAAILELDEALTLFDHATTTTDRSWAAYARSHRGAAALFCGEDDRGLHFYEGAMSRVRAAGSDGVTIIILGDFAGWLVDLGETARARGMLQEALALAADHHGIWLMGSPLIGLALAEAIEGKAAAAARYLGAVESLQASSGVDIPDYYQRRIERATALATSALGADRFASTLAEGRSNPHGILADVLGRHAGSKGTGADRQADAARLSPW
jgi:tetratricopeptide (TPR) repeat protein